MMVSSGCSASEKKGLRYLFFSFPLVRLKIVYDTIMRKGLQSYRIFLLTSIDHFSILSSLSAPAENRMYLNCLLS